MRTKSILMRTKSIIPRTARLSAAMVLLFGATIAVTSPADAAELRVTTTADGGAGSLRASIDAANASGDADVVVLQGGAEYVLSECSAGELTVTAPLTIAGNGATIRQSCANERVLRNTGDGLLTVQNVTLTGGDGPTDGGAILSNGGPVSIIGSTITANQAAGDGGGVFVDGDAALIVHRSTITNNQAFDYGGGVGVYGELRMTESVVEGNAVLGASAYGGGIFVHPTAGVPAIVAGSTVRANHADAAASFGGGIYVDADSLTLDSSTVADNTTSGDGGGIYAYYDTTIIRSTISGNTAGGRGGGIFSYDPTLVMGNSTVIANSAAAGGGVFAEGFELDIDFVTFNANSAPAGSQVDLGGGALRSYASVFADSVGGTACQQVQGSSEGHNYEQGSDTCGLRTATDVVAGAPAGLDALAGNGGPTQTEAPAATSPLVDAILAGEAGCAGADQRGVSRPQGGACDIGAVELAVDQASGPPRGVPLAFVG